MRFDLPPPLLEALRRRRDAQGDARQGRATQATREGALSYPDPDFKIADLGIGHASVLDAFTVDVQDTHDAFLLDPGMGPMTFLTTDGRVLIDGRAWDGEALREATDEEAVRALVVGARKTAIPGLLDLIPPAPAGAIQCPQCAGSRIAELVPGLELVCMLCSGYGWSTRAAIDDAAANGLWPRRS